MILLGFAGFLRYDELSSLRCNDIFFHDDHFCLKIRKSKTDQYRLGNEIVISKGMSVACPYKMLRRYLTLSSQTIFDSNYLFRPCFRSNSTCKLIYKDKPLSYSRARECIISRLRPFTGDLNIGLHSLRSGGATTAANSGVNDRCWKRHGRWKSDISKDRYVADSLSSRLMVSQKLSL
jgi:integrase